MTGTTGETVRFRPTNGRLMGILGLVVCAGAAFGFAVSGSAAWAVSGVLACVLGAVLIWASMLRPGVSASSAQLHLTNLFVHVDIPLASIESVEVRRYLLVRSGGKSYICPAVSRSLRKIVRSKMKWTGGANNLGGPGDVSQRMGRLATETTTVHDLAYADFVEQRITQLAADDRARRGIEPRSEEEYELGSQVERRPAWVVIGAIVVLAVAFVVSLVIL
jgi:hypothetical protein